LLSDRRRGHPEDLEGTGLTALLPHRLHMLAGDLRKGRAPVKPTTSHRPPGGVPSLATAVPPGGPWLAARLAVVALILWAVLDMLRTTLAVGCYEHRITAVTHGDVDVLPASMAYDLINSLMPSGMATIVADR